MVFKEYLTVRDIFGPLMLVERVDGVTYGEMAEIKLDGGQIRRGRVLEIADSCVLVQVFEGTLGLGRDNVRVKFLGRGLEIGVSPDIVGRVFDGAGRAIDGGPDIIPDKKLNIN
ncbi:MAG: V-type ATP synthase subunit B, partial [Planctomycetota bacterium]